MNEAMNLNEVDVDQVVALIGQASDEQIAEGVYGPQRQQMQAEVFRRMQEEYKPGGQDAVIHWTITRPDGDPDRWEVVIENGTCTATDQPSREPRVTMTLSGVDFMKLVTGNAAGPMMFMSGKLKISGDVAFAALMQGMFRIPSKPAGPASGSA